MSVSSNISLLNFKSIINNYHYFSPFACCSTQENIEDSKDQTPQINSNYSEKPTDHTIHHVRVKSTSTPPSGLAPIASPDIEEEVKQRHIRSVFAVNSSNMNNDIEEPITKVEIKNDEFNGLIGNIAGNLIRDKMGGGAAGDILGGLAGNFLGGGGGGQRGGGGGGDIGNLIGGLVGGGGNRGNDNYGGGNRSGGGGSKF